MVYQNLTKTRTFKIEPRQKGYAVMEYRLGRKPKGMAVYGTQAEAETVKNVRSAMNTMIVH